MITLVDWVAVIPPEDKQIAYVGESESYSEVFLLTDMKYRDYAFYLDLTFDLSTVTTQSQPREIQNTQQSTTELVNAEGMTVTSTANTSKESYTQADVTVDASFTSDVVPLAKLVEDDGIYLTWTVRSQHTQLPGVLRATLRAVGKNGEIKKSSVMTFYVAASVSAAPAKPVLLTEHEQMERAMELALEQAAQATLDDFNEHLESAIGTVVEFDSYIRNRFDSTDEQIRALRVPATNEQIDAKSDTVCPIVPANLEYAVKSVGDNAYEKKGEVFELRANLDQQFVLFRDNITNELRTPATTMDLGMVLAADTDLTAEDTGVVGGKQVLSTVKATSEMIDARENNHCPIVPANLEYAVKSVGDGYYAVGELVDDAIDGLNNAMGNYEERLGDLERRTASKIYEKIATITVVADADGSLPKHIIFSADSNGKSFELESFYVKALIGATDGSAARLTLSINGGYFVFGTASLGSVLSTTPQGWAMYYKNFGENEGALCIAQALASGSSYPTGSNINNASFTGGVILPYMTAYKPVSSIDFWFNVGTKKTFTAGTKMELWGVRK